jgi:hypothetical protein
MKIENTKTIIYYTKENIETIENMIKILDVLSNNTVICEQFSGMDMPYIADCLEAMRYNLFNTNFKSDLIELRLVPWEVTDSEKKKEYTVDDLLGDDYPF